jgi:hypothetical protein
MKLKPGVSLLGLKPEAHLALHICEDLYRRLDVELVVTSVVEGKHSRQSRHQLGYAFDLRVHNVPADLRQELHQRIKNTLGAEFVVLWESIGDPHEHIHVHFKGSRKV